MRMWKGLASALVMGVAGMLSVPEARAGGPPLSPGEEIVQQADLVLGFLADEHQTGVAGFALATAERLAALDAAGASPARLEAFASQRQILLDRLTSRQTAKIQRLTRASMVRLVGFDEDALIQQLTDVDEDRDAALDALDADNATASQAISDALAAELGD